MTFCNSSCFLSCYAAVSNQEVKVLIYFYAVLRYYIRAQRYLKVNTQSLCTLLFAAFINLIVVTLQFHVNVHLPPPHTMYELHLSYI